MPGSTNVGFKKRTTLGTIEPWTLPNSVAMTAKIGIAVYPNPAATLIIIERAKGMHISITDILGQEVYGADMATEYVQVSLAGMASGVYMVTAHDVTGRHERFRVVKQ
jgi:hypothetical protein